MEDPDTTCNKLPISDTSDTASEISITIHSQDEYDLSTDYNAISPPRNYQIPMTPPKTHKAMLPRPSCIPVPKTLSITKNQQNKDNTSGDEITSDTEHTGTMPPTRTCPIQRPRPSKATNIKQKVQTNANNQLKFIQTQHQLENHLYYLHHQHKADKQLYQDHQQSIAAENQPFQEYQCSTTTDFTNNHTPQDHSTINGYHYCLHTRFQHFQAHSNTHQDISHSKYITYQFYYCTCHNTTLHRNKKTEKHGFNDIS